LDETVLILITPFVSKIFVSHLYTENCRFLRGLRKNAPEFEEIFLKQLKFLYKRVYFERIIDIANTV